MNTENHTNSGASANGSFPTITIPQTDMDECKAAFTVGGVKAYEALLRNKTQEWKTVPLNIGVIGNSGAGKSSFINGIRDLDGDDEGAAEVGVTETTMESRSYSHPNNEMMKFWDLPGVGTNLFPKESYLEKIGFEKFDFFLILSHIRFTELDTWLSKEIRNKGKQFFFVRTKIQCDIVNDQKAHPKKYRNDSKVVIKELLHQVRVNLQENLGNIYEEGIVFIIDSYERNKFDFALLAQRLVEDFPGLKRQAFIFSMNTFSEQMVRVKAQELRSTLWQYSSLSGLAAIAPLPGLSASVDCALIIKASNFFYNQLGLGDLSLQKIAYFTKTNSVTLQNIAEEDRDVDKLLTVQGIEQIIRNTPALMVSAAVEEYLHVFPYGGSVVAAPLSFGTTYYILNFILNKMEECILRVVKTAAENASINATDNE